MAKTRSLLTISFLMAAFASCGSALKKQMYVGTAVSVNHLTQDAMYKQLVDQHFSVITAENEMKWGVTEKERGKEQTKDADTLNEYIIKTNKKLRAHTILAHTQNPDWIQGVNKEDMKTAAYTHMELIFKKYAKNMIAMDVCNEILDEGALRQTIWLQTWGEEFVVDIFTKARELAKMYNPDVLLFINDFSIEDKNAKSDKMLELATSLKKKGILDAVGFQSHLEVGKFPKGFKENLQRFTDAGLLVALSELDIRIKLQGRSESEIAQDRLQQTKDFEAAFEVCSSLEGCVGITLWGVSDQYSWIPTNPGTTDAGEALMFDKDYKPKPAFDSLKAYFTPSKSKRVSRSRCA
ncbi:glycosyl hydrolase family 10 [Puccinia graminis f. sp. tritici CRL 75-36-700-3]|uniref:Beta-xylanase n=1 Tax=Puccinia graminis f. sp. tritici (strain CRL 75-36-700-3 / race SCCL) TaxID=418459 RepID=E3L548_PUCGT|nr:glycosyl hydrolase family 10 [Puccinia graminis f. sp. tritici CRL 75-36-700-3]EFP91673.1 glycosyl hydrolase family 10 [Puccinia graminis f. sp. tritici CRL 75-36-700-3]